MTAAIDLASIWAFIIAFAVFVYIVMDGFDLGLGILYPLFPNKTDRDVIMNSVAPVWDGNETWLVLGGGGLMAAFPLAYAVLMPAVYTPMIAMLLGLIFRGVAFEFRWRATQSGRNPWDLAFTGGSLLAALAQGIALGAILQGVHVEGRHYGGGWWDWLTPFSILTGLALVVGYALLGATWLVMKTEGELRDKAYRLSWYLLFAMLGAIAAVSIATPFLNIQYTQRWFSWPNIILTRRYRSRLPALPFCCCAPSPTNGTISRSFCRWRCSRCPMPGSASACIPILCHRASPSGRRRRLRTASASC
jgi:cytochrome d ubiquinol oxidase subunit II